MSNATGASRRGFLALLAGSALGACTRKSTPTTPAPPPVPDGGASWSVKELAFDEGPGAPQRVVVLSPRVPAGARVPLLVALHGRGESNRGLEAGAWGWVRDYTLRATAERLAQRPLTHDALAGVADEAYRAALDRGLAERPFRGLVVACPYTPDILKTRDLDEAAPFGRFLVENLIPRLRRELPVMTTRAGTAIDGVSLGGRMALLAGLRHPETFGAIGTLQAAFRRDELPEVVKRARVLLAGPLPSPRLRVLTSTGDPFRPTLEALASALRSAGLSPELSVVPGPHSYAFNRGPGGVEMLLWHDRVLARSG